MKAIQIEKNGDFDVLQHKELPKPIPGPGQVLVKNEYAGINFIDSYHRAGLYPVPLPAILGIEGAGTIESIGENVTGFKTGDKVVYLGLGAYAEYTIVGTKHLYVVPPSVTTETACAAIAQALTAISMARYSYHVKKGDHVLIHAAAGGTGLQLVQVCKYIGATVIGTTSTPEKAAIAKSHGADHIILYNSESVSEKVNQITNGRGVQAVFDGVGKATYDESLKSLAKRGVFVSFGSASGAVPPVNVLLLPKNIVFTSPALFTTIENREEFVALCKDMFDMMAKNLLKVKIHKLYPLENVKDAQKDLTSRASTGKLLLKF